ncbi:MAG: dienelactone hydrolase family protein [Actinobacteria bacterium]|nr:dienelactone hydrolase family protein [Actinomycetota bacterium]
MAGTMVEFPANGGTAQGYLATPDDAGNGRALIVLQEWWGLVPEIKAVCDDFAAAGYTALAPDLYGGETTDQPGEAEQKMMAMNIDQTAKELSGAIDFVADKAGAQKVGTVGFCLGGGLSVFAASLNDKVGACVSYYYVMPHKKPDFSAIGAPVLMHWGGEDAWNDEAKVNELLDEMRSAGVEVSSETYPGCGHAFFNRADRLGTYDEAAAAQSLQRTLAFYDANLG